MRSRLETQRSSIFAEALSQHEDSLLILETFSQRVEHHLLASLQTLARTRQDGQSEVHVSYISAHVPMTINHHRANFMHLRNKTHATTLLLCHRSEVRSFVLFSCIHVALCHLHHTVYLHVLQLRLGLDSAEAAVKLLVSPYSPTHPHYTSPPWRLHVHKPRSSRY